MSEILTIQVGHSSNFIGTHWWNLQESCFVYDTGSKCLPEINPRITFREGVTRNGIPTFAPRAICIDLKGSLKSLPEEGSLYGKSSPDKKSVPWDGKTVVHAENPEEKNEFLQDLEAQENPSDQDKDICSSQSFTQPNTEADCYDLDDSVAVWSDFSRVHLHAKSVYLLKEHQHSCSDDSFNVFGNGKQIYNTEAHQDEIQDRIRYFVEECDLLQGFNVLIDAQNGFSGFGTSLVEDLREEYSKNGIYIMPNLIFNSNYKSQHHILNSLLCYDGLVDSATLFSPVSLFSDVGRRIQNPVSVAGVQYNSDLMYHTSSLIAAALDCISSSYRCRTLKSSMTDLEEMASHGKKACAVSLNMDNSYNGAHASSLTPSVKSFDGDLQWLTYRGNIDDSICSQQSSRSVSKHEQLENNILSSFKYKRRCFSRVSIVEDEQKLQAPFPNIKDTSGGSNILAGLHSCDELKDYFSQLTLDVVKSYKGVSAAFKQAGLENDEYLEALHKIKNLSDAYSVSYEQ